MNIQDLQSFMSAQSIDTWVIHDFRGSNPIFPRLLPPEAPAHKRFLTRRVQLHIPRVGSPTLLVHAIDESSFSQSLTLFGEPVKIRVYLSWQDLARAITDLTKGCATIVMEYSPNCELPAVSYADAGAIELVRSSGPAPRTIISSADLIQLCIARWDEHALAAHERASAHTTRIMRQSFDLIRAHLAERKHITEKDVHQFIHQQFREAGLETDSGPVVAVNAHAADPHFEVSMTDPSPILPGDWILIDLWAREPGDHNVYSDICWVGYASGPDRSPIPYPHFDVFNTVKKARDTALLAAQTALKIHTFNKGWNIDEAARNVLIRDGHEAHIRHRTGHSLSPGPLVHGVGVNIDNLETHDTRTLIPGVGFTIEPGLYFPPTSEHKGFGIRMEINVYIDPVSGPRVTSCIQDEIVWC